MAIISFKANDRNLSLVYITYSSYVQMMQLMGHMHGLERASLVFASREKEIMSESALT